MASMRSSKESSRFFSVEAVALQNLPQTFRGRERSKRGYAADLLRFTQAVVGIALKKDLSDSSQHYGLGTKHSSPLRNVLRTSLRI